MIDTGLNGRVVLITGANHRIGAATARAFAAQGAAVFLQYLCVPPEGQGGSGGETAPPGEALYRSRRLISAGVRPRPGARQQRRPLGTRHIRANGLGL